MDRVDKQAQEFHGEPWHTLTALWAGFGSFKANLMNFYWTFAICCRRVWTCSYSSVYKKHLLSHLGSEEQLSMIRVSLSWVRLHWTPLNWKELLKTHVQHLLFGGLQLQCFCWWQTQKLHYLNSVHRAATFSRQLAVCSMV